MSKFLRLLPILILAALLLAACGEPAIQNEHSTDNHAATEDHAADEHAADEEGASADEHAGEENTSAD